MGTASTVSDSVCCSETIRLEAAGIVTSPGHAVAWGLTTQTAGAITSTVGVSIAADAGLVFQANTDGSFDFTNNCPNIPGGYYYFTPFIIEDPVIAPLVYDTLNGCRPDGQICPTFSTNLDWMVDTLMGVFPNGDTIDLVRQLTESLLGTPGGLDLDIDQTLLTTLLGGTLPCLQLTNLFAGDPNGTWTFIVSNIGTGALEFTVPDFEVMVDADSCAALGGVNQTVIIPGSTTIIPPGGQYVSIQFLLPPLPVSFPAISPTCEAYGDAVLVYVAEDASDCFNSILENNIISQIMLKPNPAMDNISLSVQLKKESVLSVTIHDVFGREILQREFGESLKQHQQNFDISMLAAGVYLFHVKAGDEVRSMRVVKQ